MADSKPFAIALRTVAQAIRRGGNMADDYREHCADDFVKRFGLTEDEANFLAITVRTLFAEASKPALRRGMYETDYGNTASYKGGKTALDLDADERVPVELLARFIRPFDKDGR